MTKRIVFFIITLLLALFSTACADYGSGQYAGKWDCVTVEFMGVPCDPDLMYDKQAPVLAIYDTGRASFSVNGSTLHGEWTETANGISITSGGTAMEFIFADDQLSCQMYGSLEIDTPVTLFFEKAE